ncbi:hypothetical protein [Azospirillum argentinense]
MLADQELQLGDRRDVEVDDRAEFLLPHDAERGQHRRDQQQQDRDDRRHDGLQALDVRVVAEAGFDGGEAGRLAPRGQPLAVHALHIAADRLGARRHGTIDPRPDLDRTPAGDVAPEARRDFQRQGKVARPHAPVEILVVDDRRPFDEVAGAREGERVVAAHRRLVPVQDREGQVLDVHVDAIAHDDHQQEAADQGERRADGIAPQLQRLQTRVAEHAPRVEEPAFRAFTGRGGGRRNRPATVGRRRRIAFPARRHGLLQITDEGLLQRRSAALGDERRRRVADQHAAGVHQRDAVAAFGLVHEMRRDEDRHPVPARQPDHDLPERVARDGIDARRRLVQDQHGGLVNHRDGEGQALALAEGQAVRQRLHRVGEAEALRHRRDPVGKDVLGHLEQAGVQLQVLPDRQLRIEREGLGHVADAPPGLDVAGVHRLPEQPGLALARLEQAGQHLHRRRLAAAVGAEEAEDLAARYAEADMVDRHETAEAHGQALRLDGDVACVPRARHDRDGLVAAALLLGHQRDEGLLQRRGPGALQQVPRAAGGQHAPLVHGDEPVEARRLLHVGGGHHHAHAGPVRPYAVDQLPELPAGERVHARGRLVEDQQVRIVDERAAQAELLLHAAGQLAGGPVEERRQTGALRQVGDAPPSLGVALAEQPSEEVEILGDRQRRVEVLAEALRHVGDAGAHGAAVACPGHAAAQHLDRSLLQGARARHQRQQTRLADAVGADQPRDAPRRNIEADPVDGPDLSVQQTNVPQTRNG